MTLDEFRATVSTAQPPPVSPALTALWWDAKGDWARAHQTAQDLNDETGAWVHAYLHRKEGDEGNAAHWYHRAKRPIASDSLDAEWARIVETLLK